MVSLPDSSLITQNSSLNLALFRLLPARRFLLILLSLAAGATTHIIWDGFTHADEWAFALLPVLDRPMMTLGGHTVRVYHVLQHGSTLMGGALLLGWYVAWYRKAPAGSLPAGTAMPRPVGIAMAAVAALCLGCLVAAVSPPHPGGWTRWPRFLREWVICTMAVAAVEVFLFGAWWRLRAAGKLR